MQEIVSKCGNICTECPWSTFMRQKITEEDWELYSKTIKEYIGYKPTKYEWEGCVGCHIPDEDLPKHPHYGFLKNCRTRKCVTHNEMQTCAHCKSFPCGNTVSSDESSMEKMSLKMDREISIEEYNQYLRMFDSLTNLQSLKSKLKKTDIKEPKPINGGYNVLEFPPMLRETHEQYFQLHSTIRKIISSNLGLSNVDTIAGFERHLVRRNFFLRLFWIVGSYKDLKDTVAKIDSSILHEHRKKMKLPHNEEGWNDYIHAFKEHGIKIMFKALTKDLYTPGGWMREKIPGSNAPAYAITLKLDPKIIMTNFFHLLSNYVKLIDVKYKKRGFSQFKKLNMSEILP
jgi:hypothetical protein